MVHRSEFSGTTKKKHENVQVQGLKMSEKAENVQRKTFRKPGEQMYNTTLKEYQKVLLLGRKKNKRGEITLKHPNIYIQCGREPCSNVMKCVLNL